MGCRCRDKFASFPDGYFCGDPFCPAFASSRAALNEAFSRASNPFDLHTPPDLEPRRLWLDDREHRFCILDPEDYAWAIRWRWGAKPNSRGRKFYAYRAKTWRVGGEKRVQSEYLHVEIMRRVEPPPTPRHTMVDHINGNSLDNCRDNLCWVTPRQNARNRRRR